MNPTEKLKRKDVFVVIGEKIPEIIFTADNYQAEFVVFEKNEFEDILFENIDLENGIVFKDCDFKGYASFKNIKIDKYDHNLNTNSESLTFINCDFRERVFIGNKSLVQRAVVFKNCKVHNGLEIIDLNISTEGLKFENTIIEEKLDIFRSHFKQGISFISNQINTYLRINVVNGSGINFTSKNVITGNLHISNCQLEHGIVFNDGNFQDDVYFSLIQTRNSGLSINGTNFEKSFFINYHHGTVRPNKGIAKFYLSESIFKNGIYIKGNEVRGSENSPIIENITIACTAKLAGNIMFSDLDVGEINLSGFNANANIEFKNVYVNEFVIQSFTNNSGLILTSINSSFEEWLEPDDNSKSTDSKFLIDDSNLGKAQIYSVDFESFDNVVIGNTTLTDVSTSMVKWFLDEKLNAIALSTAYRRLSLAPSGKSKEATINARQNLIHFLNIQKEVYRQIKVVNEKRGDIPLSLEFKRSEMIYLEKITKLKYRWYTSESLILASSRFSNDFGQNWIKAFWLLLIFSFVCYIPIGFLTSDKLDYSKGFTSYADLLFNLRVILDNIKVWAVILNPAHRVSEIHKNIDNYSSWILFWDLLSRVVISYFLFQMVSAFRKYNK